MTARIVRLLGGILRDLGIVTEEQLKQGLSNQKKTGKLLGRVLVEFGFITEKELLKALGMQIGLQSIDFKDITPSKEALQMVSPALCKLYKILPIKFERNTLTIAVSDPLDLKILDDLKFMLNCNVKGVVAEESDIESVLTDSFGTQGDSIEGLLDEIGKKIPMLKVQKPDDVTDTLALQELASQAPVVRLVNLILLQAIKDRASDIHFEPFENEFKIRYRVDGILYEISHPPTNLNLAITSRLKVISNLDIAERRLPQDGRIMISMEGKEVDLRVSTLPTVFGESVVIRVLDRTVVSLSLDQVGLREDAKKILMEIIHKPNGMVLATGPTGCGKTTTLYSCLRAVNKIDYKIITTEDPVEYDIQGIIQVPIKPKINLNFATCLRHILRQDPDIVMVGEIRDTETVQIAIQASLTGHLVFSTLHTNDAPGAITRMINMGAEPYLISSTLEAILAQRLVRVICQKCKEVYIPSAKELEELEMGSKDIKGRKFYRGRGCEHCSNTGYKGRTGIFELLVINDEIRSLITQKVQTGTLRDAGRRAGMRTLREDGLMKIFDGVTTIEEVARETLQYR